MLRIGLLTLACVFFISPAEARHRRVVTAPAMQPFAWSNLFASSAPVHRPITTHKANKHRHKRRVLPSGVTAHPITVLPRPRPAGVSLIGVVPQLATKVTDIVGTCGSEVVSTVRHTYVAGTNHISQHANGTAVDITGNPSCIYSMLRGWPGGYSVDYRRVHHVHISIGGHEAGLRFVHGGGHRRHYAHHHRHRYRYVSFDDTGSSRRQSSYMSYLSGGPGNLGIP